MVGRLAWLAWLAYLPVLSLGIAHVAACSGSGSGSGSEAGAEAGAGAGGPAVPAPQAGDPAPLPEAAAVRQSPPPPGPNTRLVEKIAEKYGVGVARCPLIGNGRVTIRYGMERDQLVQFGPSWETEWDAATAPPWDPVFDEVVGEDDWVSILVMPGATTAWVTARTKIFAWTIPPAEAGKTVVCTEVHETKPRAVRGKVNGKNESDTFVFPCIPVALDSVFVASDSTFVAEIPTPCTMWVEGGKMRSEKKRIDEGEGHLDVELTLADDPMVKDASRVWSEDGFTRIEGVLKQIEERSKRTEVFLDELAKTFADDKSIQTTIKLHRYRLKTVANQSLKTRIAMEAARQGQ